MRSVRTGAVQLPPRPEQRLDPAPSSSLHGLELACHVPGAYSPTPRRCTLRAGALPRDTHVTRTLSTEQRIQCDITLENNVPIVVLHRIAPDIVASNSSTGSARQFDMTLGEYVLRNDDRVCQCDLDSCSTAYECTASTLQVPRAKKNPHTWRGRPFICPEDIPTHYEAIQCGFDFGWIR